MRRLPVDAATSLVDAARSLVEAGPRVVALAVGSEASVVAWAGGHAVLPLLGGEPVDPTGGGDAVVAGLAAALLRGDDPESAGWFASAAAASTVRRRGGRPDLDAAELAWTVREARGRGR